MKKLVFLFTVAAAGILLSQTIPQTINYQGLLKDNAGNPAADGDYNIVFRLYDRETGGNELWSEINIITVTNGIINTQLGGQNPLDIPFDQEIWLGITIASENELVPRMKLSSVPYSFMTMNVRDESVTSAKIADGSIAANDIGSGQVVKSINGLNDNVTLTAGSNVTITPSENTLTISSTGGGGGIGGSGTANYIPRLTGSTTIGNSVLYQNSGNIGLGTTTPAYPLHVSTNRRYSGYFTSDSLWSGTSVLYAEYKGTGNSNAKGVTAKSVPSDGVGIGGDFTGGFVGVAGNVTPTGSLLYYGVAGGVSGGTGHNYGVSGWASGAGTNYAVDGQSDGPGQNAGGHFVSNSSEGVGVYALADVSTGIVGATNSATSSGVFGIAYGSSGKNFGVSATTNSPDGIAIYGTAPRYGIEGEATNTSGIADGVRALTMSSGGSGLFAWASEASGTNYGIYAGSSSAAGYAGYFVGRVNVTGSLTKGGGAFKIDHPLDPQNKYLYHSFVESPDMKNIYDGNVVTDGSGYAQVLLPDWFEALNKDFRYQLTVIGDFAQAIISGEIQNNRFEIKTDKPGIKVSWQVTGIRKDAFAEKHRIPVEEEKTVEERGRYLYPEVFGATEDQGIDSDRRSEVKERKNLPADNFKRYQGSKQKKMME